MSQKPFPVGKRQRDECNEFLIVSPDEKRKGPLVRAKPLRGYLEKNDYEMI